MRRILSTRTIVVTGGTSGIGRATALLFARHGWRVALVARGTAGLDNTAAAIRALGATASTHAADVADGPALAAAAAAIEAELGPVHVWVNCAGNGVFGPFTDVDPAQFDRVTATTYTGTVNGTRTALALMRPRSEGTIVNICSAIAFHALPGLSSYAGAKYAVRGFSQAVRHELHAEGSRIRLTTVFPPAVNTPFFSHAPCTLPGAPRPAKPVYQPEIVADAVLLATQCRRNEIRISGTVALFAFCCATVPFAIHLAMQKLGTDGQMTDLPAATALHAPTLDAPSPLPSPTHGPFTPESRTFSFQMWATRRRIPLLLATLALLAAIYALLA